MNRILLCVLLSSLAISGCEQNSEPVSPSHEGLPQILSKAAGGKTSLDLIEEDYDAGLLEKNNACLYREYSVSSPDRLPAKYRSDVPGKDATYSMVQIARTWNELSAATRKEITEIRANGFGVLKQTVTTAHFVLHYATESNFSVPLLDNDADGIPDYIELAAVSWENVWTVEVGRLGFTPPKHTPEQKFHVYYKNMPYYGYTVPEDVELQTLSPVPLGTAAAWIAVENDFYGFPRNDEDVTGMEVIRSGALKVTQAHEFMHALQFNINVYQSGWLMESCATWAEDAAYNTVNDWHWYVGYFLRTPDYPIFNRYSYGSAFFINYLTEEHGAGLVRSIWEAATTRTAPDAIRDVAFGGTWEDMKFFAPAEYLLNISDYQVPSVIPRPTNLIRAVHGTYPVNVQVSASTNKMPNRAPWGLGANFIEFLPDGHSSLTVSFDGTDGYAWRAFLVTTTGNSSLDIHEMALDAASSGSATIKDFDRRVERVALVVTIADRGGSEVPFVYSAATE